MYKRILIPVDGSETSTKALIAALQLARDSDGCVRLVHVMDELSYLSGYDQYAAYSGDLIQIMRETGIKVLKDAMAIAQSSGVAADNVLSDTFGERLGDSVADAARQWPADLIVVGTHGRRGLGRVLLGSGAEQIVRLAPVPVLVIRGQQAESSP